MIRRPPRSTLDRSSAASDVYKRQDQRERRQVELDRTRRRTFADHDVDLEIFERRVEAVSYTHLRAHETVLDLVCRLLLEKKKTTKQPKRVSILYVAATHNNSMCHT